MTDLQDEVARARADPARRFGRFLLLSELGRGGMGVVHRAWDERLRREVALKTILPRPGDAASEQALRRFQREGEAIGRLRHPSIVSVYELGEEAGTHYLVMDLVRGSTLDRRLAEGRLPLTRALEVLRDV